MKPLCDLRACATEPAEPFFTSRAGCIAKKRFLFYNDFIMKTVAGEEFRLRLPEGARFALAFSGGRDSVALFDLLKGAGADFFAVHVEHGIRGEASLADAAFAEAFSSERGVECKVFHVDAPAYARERGLTLEQAARELRYGVLDGLIGAGECDCVLLAHHADDQTETILMRLLRGTGVRGLKGMSEASGERLRPLLSVQRSEIDAYVAERGLPYREDETNGDEAYTRNFLRGELARLKERFPAVNAAFARLARSAAEADALIEELAPVPEVCGGEARVPVTAFASPALAKRCVLRACRALGVEQDVEEKHYEAVIGLIGTENGSRTELSHGITAHLDGEHIVFTRGREERDEREIPFPQDGECAVMGVRIERVPERSGGEEGALYADLDAIPQGAVLRKRRDGDRITKFGGGTKSFGDFLTDKKVPKRMRESITVCAAGHEILFAAGVEISDKVRVTPSTRNVIKITEDKNVR